jgi:hypothetical protein
MPTPWVQVSHEEFRHNEAGPPEMDLDALAELASDYEVVNYEIE